MVTKSDSMVAKRWEDRMTTEQLLYKRGGCILPPLIESLALHLPVSLTFQSTAMPSVKPATVSYDYPKLKGAEFEVDCKWDELARVSNFCFAKAITLRFLLLVKLWELYFKLHGSAE